MLSCFHEKLKHALRLQASAVRSLIEVFIFKPSTPRCYYFYVSLFTNFRIYNNGKLSLSVTLENKRITVKTAVLLCELNRHIIHFLRVLLQVHELMQRVLSGIRSQCEPIQHVLAALPMVHTFKPYVRTINARKSNHTPQIAQNTAETCQKYFQSFIAIEILSQYFRQILENISLQHYNFNILKYFCKQINI